MLIIHIQLFYYIVQQDYGSRLKQMELHEKYLRTQISSYEQMEQSARQTRHDFRHHNMVVAEYAREKDYEAILTYLQEYEAREEEKFDGDFCRNHVVNSLLCAYVSMGGRRGERRRPPRGDNGDFRLRSGNDTCKYSGKRGQCVQERGGKSQVRAFFAAEVGEAGFRLQEHLYCGGFV